MKKLIEKQILFLQSDEPIPFNKYKEHLEDDDIVQSSYEEPFFSENNSCDGFYYVKILRKTLETDEQYEKRLEKSERTKLELKNRRRETYLKLKDEFENEHK
jgi:hypothetical protein